MVSNRIIKIDLNKKTKNVVQLVQGDTNRKLTIKVYDSDEPYLVDGVGGGTIHGAVYIEKPDGTTCGYDSLEDDSPAVTGSGNTLTVYFVPQATTAHGWAYMTVSIFDDDGVELNTFGIDLFIDKKATATISEDYWNLKSIEGITAAVEGLSASRCVRIYNGEIANGIFNMQTPLTKLWPSAGVADGDYVISKNLVIMSVSNCSSTSCLLTVQYRIDVGGGGETPSGDVTFESLWNDITSGFNESGLTPSGFINSITADGHYKFFDGDELHYVVVVHSNGGMKYTEVKTLTDDVTAKIEFFVNNVSCGGVNMDVASHNIRPFGMSNPINANDGVNKTYADCGNIVNVATTTPSILCASNTTYVCGTCTSLTIRGVPSDGSVSSVIFTSGSTPTTLSINGDIYMPDGFEVEANTRYEMTFKFDYGTAIGWPIATS